jgi:PAS domain S-box-containing protein
MKQRILAQPSERPLWQNYGFAVLTLAGALIARRLLDFQLHDTVPLATMYVGVAFAVWFGGWKPAAAVAIVGYIAALWWFWPPRYSFKLWESFGGFRTLLYFLSCFITIFLCESLHRARRRHAESEAKVRSILENMRECFCSVDDTWRVTAVNRSAEKGLGQPREKLLGRELWDILPEIAGRPAERDLRRTMSNRVPVQFETNALIPRVWHTVTATPELDGISIFFQDITASRAHLDHLERLVDDRTAALQRVISELESFSYTLVHDMRAPLRAISGFAEILADDHAEHLNPDGRGYLARIQKSAMRMDQLIVDILTYSQLSRGAIELRAIDLDRMLREMLHSDPELQPARADVRIEGPLPTIRGNEALVVQCFSNLLHNATKFVAPGVKPQIRISAQVNATVARVEVCDNGIGIHPEATARIFEPFRREHPAYDGTGIGLAIVRKVVDQMNGRVGVESQVARGSRFWVELKLEGQTPQPTPAADRAAAQALI